MRKLTLAILCISSVAAAANNGTGPDPGFIRQSALTRGFSLGRPTQATPTPDGKAVLFLRAEPRNPVNVLYEFDVATGQARELLTPAALLKGAEESLSQEEKARRERMRVSARGFTTYKLSRDGAQILVGLSGRLYVVKRSTGAVTALKTGDGATIDPSLSPDGKAVAYVKDRDLYVLDLASQRERRLTRSTDPAISNGLAEFVAQEEMGRFSGFWWSPDSKSLAFEEADSHGVEKLYITDPAKPENAPEATFYPRPGKANVKVRLGVVAATGGKVTWVGWDVARYPYLATVRWQDQAPLTLLVQSRDEKHVALLTASAAGKTRQLLTEEDAHWINLDQTVPSWLPDGSGFLWSSEESGTRLLALHGPDGKRVRLLSSAADGYERLEHVDDAHHLVWFRGAPVATERHVFRVSYDGSGAAERVTQEPGAHGASFGRGHDVWLENVATPTAMPRTLVHAGDRLAGELPSVAEKPTFTARTEYARVGTEQWWTAIVRPRAFDPQRKYPVIVDVYGGPHSQKVMLTYDQGLQRQWMADHGVIVVAIDGRGTPARGRDWERYISKDFTRTLDDQVTALKALGAKYPEMDLSRVGITGWSFGGYLSALAVLKRPDVYHVAVAGAPVVDWHDYDTHYTEHFIGLPDDNAAGYHDSSLLTYADKLSRPLLIVHGTSDDNVYFFHSLKLTSALFRAGKPFSFLPLPGFTHMVADASVREQLTARTMQFLLAILKP